MTRLILLVLLLAFAVVLPFAIWGGELETFLSVEGTIAWMKGTGWAWAAGIALIVSDIVLPVPSSAVMAALGVLYGPLVGGALSAFASILAGSGGYWLCRLLGPGFAERLAGPAGIIEARRLFDRWGFVLIAISRWLPVLPETVAFLAGLIRVPFPRFLLALSCGAVPLGFVYATAGHLGRETPLVVIALCMIAPVALWAGWRLSRRSTDR